MKKLTKYNKFVLLVVGLIAVFTISSIFSGTAVYSSQEENKIFDPQPISAETSEYMTYLERILDIFNFTMDDYINGDENFRKQAHMNTVALWGYENGTFTEEEAENYCFENTPYVRYYGDGPLLNPYYDKPLKDGIISKDDENGFKIRVMLVVAGSWRERITNVKMYLDTDADLSHTSYQYQLEAIEVRDVKHEGGVSSDGMSWEGHAEWHLLTENYVVVDFQLRHPPVVDNWIKVKIRWEWQYWRIIGQYWENKGAVEDKDNEVWYDQPGIGGMAKYENLKIVDDDPNGPDISITYTGAYTDEVPGDWIVGVSDPSGITSTSVTVNNVPVTLVGGRYHIPNELGTYEIKVTAIDADNDRANDHATSTKSDTVTIVDDDTSEPVLCSGIPSDTFYGDQLRTYYLDFTDFDQYGSSGNCPLQGLIEYRNDNWELGVWRNAYDDGHAKVEYLGSAKYRFYFDVPTGFLSCGTYTIRNTIYENDQDRSPDGIVFPMISREQIPLLSPDRSYTVVEYQITKLPDPTAPEIDIDPPMFATYDYDPGYWHVNIYEDYSSMVIVTVYVDKIEVDFSESGNYDIPNVPGPHVIDVVATNNDPCAPKTKTDSDTFTVYDDDPWAPEFHTLTNEQYISDDTSILQESVVVSDVGEGIDYVYADLNGAIIYGTLDVDYIDSEHPDWHRYLFNIPCPPKLGEYSLVYTAFDKDGDRPNDALSTSLTIPLIIYDDDTEGPDITITYVGGNTDGNPGGWTVVATDPSDISSILVNIDDNPDPITPVDGVYLIPDNFLGAHTISVVATDDDSDRVGEDDRASNSESDSIILVDDDTEGPDITITYVGDKTDGNPGGWTVVATDPSEISSIIVYIDDWSESITPVFGVYLIPDNFLGDHTISVVATDDDSDRENDFSSNTGSDTIVLVDDDTEGPDITITYDGSGTDGDPGGWIVTAVDPSDISSILVYIDDNPYPVESIDGVYLISEIFLGEHTISVIATDDDSDRGIIDRVTSDDSSSITLIDDDTMGPEIIITYVGGGTDGDPGGWSVTAIDPSDISSIIVKVDGSITNPIDGIYLINKNNVGLPENIIEVYATDADNDREFDQEVSYDYDLIWLVDDDTEAPIICNFEIKDEIYLINISFDAYDYSGISHVKVFVDGEFMWGYYTDEPDLQNHFEILIFNEWSMDIGTHEVIVEVWDGDNDNPHSIYESMCTTLSGSFEIVFEEMKEFVLWEIDQLIIAIQESPDELWTKDGVSQKSTMISKLEAVRSTVLSDGFVGAYDKILHDIKPLLTGLNCDETGDIFGNGFFNNAWFTGDDFIEVCDQILAHIQILIDETS